MLGPSPQRDQGPEDQADPKMMQQYVDYMVLNPSRSSVHMQTPLLDPYTYHKVGGMFRQTLQNSLLKPCCNILLCREKSPMCQTRLNQNISESNTLLFYFCVSLPPSGQSSTCLLCVCVCCCSSSTATRRRRSAPSTLWMITRPSRSIPPPIAPDLEEVLWTETGSSSRI